MLSQALDRALDAAAAAGVLFVVAAGNDNDATCEWASSTLSVAATRLARDGVAGAATEGTASEGGGGAAAASGGAAGARARVGAAGREAIDVRSEWSNHGSCMDVFAPGSDIEAAFINRVSGPECPGGLGPCPGEGSDVAYRTLSGTSMAAAHVAAVAAIALQRQPQLSAPELKDWVLEMAMRGLVREAGAGSPNLMLHVPCDRAPLGRRANASTSTTRGKPDDASLARGGRGLQQERFP